MISLAVFSGVDPGSPGSVDFVQKNFLELNYLLNFPFGFFWLSVKLSLKQNHYNVRIYVFKRFPIVKLKLKYGSNIFENGLTTFFKEERFLRIVSQQFLLY